MHKKRLPRLQGDTAGPEEVHGASAVSASGTWLSDPDSTLGSIDTEPRPDLPVRGPRTVTVKENCKKRLFQRAGHGARVVDLNFLKPEKRAGRMISGGRSPKNAFPSLCRGVFAAILACRPLAACPKVGVG